MQAAAPSWDSGGQLKQGGRVCPLRLASPAEQPLCPRGFSLLFSAFFLLFFFFFFGLCNEFLLRSVGYINSLFSLSLLNQTMCLLRQASKRGTFTISAALISGIFPKRER